MKVDARWRGRGFEPAAEPAALGWQGSIRNRLCLPDGLWPFGPGSYEELWTSCIGLPSQPKQALSLPIKGPAYGLADLPDGEAGACGANINEIGLKIPVPGRDSEAK